MDVTRGLSLRTYEYFLVDPRTWLDVEPIDGITGGTITYDIEDELIASATFNADVSVGLDECYVRVYMVVIQDSIRERFVLGTFLVSCPEENFDGKRASVEARGYSPLKELADCLMPPGFACVGSVARSVVSVLELKSRLKALTPQADAELDGAYKAEANESALAFCRSMLDAARLQLTVDGMGFVNFSSVRDVSAMRPVWTFRDDERSVILPDLVHASGLGNVHNVARVVYSDTDRCIVSEAVNDNPASIVSTVVRGREVTLVETSPNLPENPTQQQVDAYAEKLLRDDSLQLNEFTFSHVYVPEVTVGCAVELDYTRAEKRAVALVTAQSMRLDEAATVECRAKFTKQVWE